MIDLDKKVRTVLEAYHDRMQAENALMKALPREEAMKRRDEFLLPVGETIGQFLNEMIKSAQAKMILEIGTSYGYSTLWMAEAAAKTGGKVVTLEIDEKKVAYAQSQIAKAGLSDVVEFYLGDALNILTDLGANPSAAQPEMASALKTKFDFVLVDIWKELYVPSFELIFPLLNPGAYVVADNMLYPPVHRKEAGEYREAVKATKAFDSVLLPIGSGIEVSCLNGL